MTDRAAGPRARPGPGDDVAGHPPRCILVGVDGSPYARRALDWALALAAGVDAEVIAVHALGLLADLGGETPVPSQTHRREVQRMLDEQWGAPLGRDGRRGRCLLVDGNPVTALLAVAEEHGADLIVVGSRGHGGFPGLQLGSTSHQLVQHADVPVVVVPPEGGR